VGGGGCLAETFRRIGGSDRRLAFRRKALWARFLATSSRGPPPPPPPPPSKRRTRFRPRQSWGRPGRPADVFFFPGRNDLGGPRSAATRSTALTGRTGSCMTGAAILLAGPLSQHGRTGLSIGSRRRGRLTSGKKPAQFSLVFRKAPTGQTGREAVWDANATKTLLRLPRPSWR